MTMVKYSSAARLTLAAFALVSFACSDSDTTSSSSADDSVVYQYENIPNGCDGPDCETHDIGSHLFSENVVAACPAWASDPMGDSYVFEASDWGTTRTVTGGSGSTGTGLIGNGDGNSKQSTACAWISACDGDTECYDRCPTAMAIGMGEGGWFPGAFAWDGNGRGLWQINYANLPQWSGCAFAYNDDPGVIPTPTSPVDCPAMNPIKLAREVIAVTDQGRNFNPSGKCWSTCNADCAKPWSPGYICETGKAAPPPEFNGPKIATAAELECAAAIEALTGSTYAGTWDAPGSCDVTGGTGNGRCAGQPTWACQTDGECGQSGPCQSTPTRQDCTDVPPPPGPGTDKCPGGGICTANNWTCSNDIDCGYPAGVLGTCNCN